jgi:hypothetical protein
MKGLDNKKLLSIFLFIIVLYLFFQLFSVIYINGQLEHDFPYLYKAGDAYWLGSVIDDVNYKGHYREMQQNLIAHTNQSLTTVEPPLFIYFASGVSNILDIESYDAINIAVILLLLASFGICFLFLYMWNTIYAYVFLPYSFMILYYPYNVLYTWGLWRPMMAIIPILASLLLFNTDLPKGNLLLLTIFFISSILAYPFYGLIFIGILILYILLRNFFVNKVFASSKQLLFIALLGILFTIPYFIDLFVSRIGFSQSASYIASMSNYYSIGNFSVGFADVIWFIPILCFSILLIIYLIHSAMQKSESEYNLYLLITLLIITTLPSFGILQRSFPIRLFWPFLFYLVSSVGFGLLIAFIVQKLNNKLLIAYAFSILIFLFMMFAFWIPTYNISKIHNSENFDNPITPKNYWLAMKEINDNTNQDSHILIVDPKLSQKAAVLNIKQPARLIGKTLFQESILKNQSTMSLGLYYH